MSKADMPDNAQDWASFLLSKQLPSPLKIGRHVLKSLEHGPQPYKKIAQSLNSDPVLSFYIMEAAGRGIDNNTEFSKTLEHALSMIGIDKLTETIQAMPVEAFSAEEVSSLYFLKTLVRALYAAHIAKRIAIEKQQYNASELFWSSMFVYVPLWHLWRFATPEMRLLRYAINTNHKAKAQAQIEILNASVEDISANLVHKLALPPLVKASYDKSHQLTPKQWVMISRHPKSQGQLLNVLDDKDLKMLIQQPTFVVQIAKLLADNALDDWYGRGTRRCQQILAAYLHKSLDDTVRMTHEVAAEMSREHPLPGILLPAARLFLPPRPSRIGKPESPGSTENKSVSRLPNSADASAESKKPSPSTKSAAPKPIYSDLVKAMYKSPSDFADLHELMNGATSALIYGLGLGRATISLINKEKTRIKCYYSTGCQDHAELSGFDAKLVKGTLFSKLCVKPSSIWIKASTDEKITSTVPMNFKQVVGIEDYFLMSIFVNEKPFAIAYCDAYPDRKLSESDYKYFKYLCKGISQAVDYLVRQKRKREQDENES